MKVVGSDKDGGGKGVQSLEVIGINKLANAFRFWSKKSLGFRDDINTDIYTVYRPGMYSAMHYITLVHICIILINK